MSNRGNLKELVQLAWNMLSSSEYTLKWKIFISVLLEGFSHYQHLLTIPQQEWKTVSVTSIPEQVLAAAIIESLWLNCYKYLVIWVLLAYALKEKFKCTRFRNEDYATETSKVVLFFCHIAHQARLAYKKDCLYTLKYCT